MQRKSMHLCWLSLCSCSHDNTERSDQQYSLNIPISHFSLRNGTYCFPYAENFYIKIDSEIMLVTAGQSTTTWTISRGQRGTAAATHSNGATINMAGGQTAMQLSPGGAVGGNAPLLGLYNAYNRLPLTVYESDTTTHHTRITRLPGRRTTLPNRIA